MVAHAMFLAFMILAAAESKTYGPQDLSFVRTIAVVSGDSLISAEDLCSRLEYWLAEYPQVRREEADLLIEYEESPGWAYNSDPTVDSPINDHVGWTATLFRLGCQSPERGGNPTSPIDGQCENGVYVRIELGRLSGFARDRESAIEAFASEIRNAAR